MNKILKTFDKQPAEALYYKVHFGEWATDQAEDVTSFEIPDVDGITISNKTLFENTVKFLVSGGTDNESYQITVRGTTPSGQVREADIVVNVLEV
jgi:predicted AAA+ superfamily ATPase